MRLHKDLAIYLREMAEFNGIGRAAYGNDLMERGIRSELEGSFTADSVRAFLLDLRTHERPDWRLLEYLPNDGRARKLPTAPV